MSFQNIKNLIVSHFIVNGRDDLLRVWTLLFGLGVFFFALMPMAAVIPIAIVMLGILPPRLFPSAPAQRMQYLMLPANHREKMTANLLLLYFYYFAGSIVVLFLGYCVAFLLDAHVFMIHQGSFAGLLVPSGCSISDYAGQYVRWLLVFNALLSAGVFSVVYFRKNAMGKMVLCLFLLFLAFAGLTLFTVWFNTRVLLPPFAMVENMYLYASVPQWVDVAVLIAVSVYFHLLSFLRLKETEA